MRIITFIFAFIFLFVPSNAQEPTDTESKKVTYSDVRKLIDDGVVERGRVSGDGWWVTVYTNDGGTYYASITPQTPLAAYLYDAGVPVSIDHVAENDESPLWAKVFYNILPYVIFLVFVMFIVLFAGKRNKKESALHLREAEKLNNDFLEKTEKLQKEFLDRLEKNLMRMKDSNG